MNKQIWDHIEQIYTLHGVAQEDIQKFKELKKKQISYTRAEGNLDHYCAFFLPYDKEKGKIYLGDHIKAEGWIPPGGHIEQGETPVEAVIREMEEELRVKIDEQMIEPYNLSVTVVNRPKSGCMTHYDIWHLIHIPEQIFDFDRGEYHQARWFEIQEGVKSMQKHPHFAKIVASLI